MGSNCSSWVERHPRCVVSSRSPAAGRSCCHHNESVSPVGGDTDPVLSIQPGAVVEQRVLLSERELEPARAKNSIIASTRRTHWRFRISDRPEFRRKSVA